jgi:SPP1 gp7 family putative phage head morphogenesis protein
MATFTPKVYEVAADFKAALLRGESAEQYAMASRFLRVEEALSDRIAALASHVSLLRAQGTEPTLGMLYRLERWQSLERQMLRELASFNVWAVDRITLRQAELGRVGIEFATETMRAAGGLTVAFDALPVDAIQAMAGFAGDGSPLASLLSDAYPAAHDAVADALIRGVTLGQNPLKVAAEMRDSLGVGLDRAFLIARTEELRSFRTAAQDTYREAGVTQYKRMATMDDATCIGCLAADGTVQDNDEVFDAHPACRCTTIPIVPGAEDPTWKSSEEWFAEQDRATQLSIMGPGRLDAWESGAASWSDLSMRTTDDTWGGAIVPRPVSELVTGGTPVAQAA